VYPLLNDFKEDLVNKGLYPCTISNVIKALIYFERYIESKDVRKITKSDIENYKTYLMTEYKTNAGKRLCTETILHRLHAITRYFKFLVERKVIFIDPTVYLEFPKKKYKLPEYIPNEKDIEEILKGPDTYTYVGIRDRLVLELAYTCPLRNKELRDLKLQDIDLKAKTIYPGRAKHGRECGIPITKGTYEALVKYLGISRPRLLKHAKADPGHLFLSEQGRPFAQGTINEIFVKYRGNKRIHPHSMRHACAVHMLKNGANIRDIQVLLGHRSIKSTMVYTVLTAKDLREMQDKYHPREQIKALHNSGKSV
jgi:integrase/recombinase XerD